MAFSSSSLLLFVSVLTFACVALGKDKDLVGPRGTEVKVLGKSGKIAIIRKINVTQGRGNESKRVVKRNMVIFEMDAIQEKDGCGGNIVGKTGRSKHSFNTFANQDFSFSTVTDAKLQNVSVKQFSFTASNIGGTGGTLKVTVYIFQEEGEIDVGKNESDAVSKGSVKFSIEISKWTFCGDGDKGCRKGNTNEVGNAIEFTITLKSKGGKKMQGKGKCGKGGKRRCGKSYNLGEGNMTLSNEVQVDGVWQEMPDGFPNLEERGNKKSLIFCFPKFANSTFYDPTVTMGDEAIEGSGEEPTDKPPTTSISGASQVFLSIALFVFAAFSALFY